jgi:hypothetical protein
MAPETKAGPAQWLAPDPVRRAFPYGLLLTPARAASRDARAAPARDSGDPQQYGARRGSGYLCR